MDKQLGVPIVIKKGDLKQNKKTKEVSSNVVHEIKRNGYLIDRFVDLQLRLGD
jgi:hypothetical protein